jgi:hypothetical protein
MPRFRVLLAQILAVESQIRLQWLHIHALLALDIRRMLMFPRTALRIGFCHQALNSRKLALKKR